MPEPSFPPRDGQDKHARQLLSNTTAPCLPNKVPVHPSPLIPGNLRFNSRGSARRETARSPAANP